jgi:hypothetical protein
MLRVDSCRWTLYRQKPHAVRQTELVESSALVDWDTALERE